MAVFLSDGRHSYQLPGECVPSPENHSTGQWLLPASQTGRWIKKAQGVYVTLSQFCQIVCHRIGAWGAAVPTLA